MATLSTDPFGMGGPGAKESALFSMDTKSIEALHGNAIEIAWMIGPLSSAAQYMDEATVAALCGAHVCFTCAGIEHSEIFSPATRGVSTLATNGADLFAVSEVCLRPAVMVYQYPDMSLHSRLEDGAQLEYVCVVFSPSSEWVAAFSGVPDYTVFLWDINTQVMIAKLPVGFAQSPQLSFCDLDTPHMALTSEVGVTVIQVEHIGPEWRLTPRTAKLDRVRSHCWAVSGNLFCSQRDRIHEISIDTMEVSELQVLGDWVAGTIVSIVLHSKGIFAAMDDGRILLLEGDEARWSVRVIADLELSVLTMRPSPSFNFLAITCKTGQVRLLYTPSHDFKALEGYEVAAARTIDACMLAPQYDFVASIHEPHGLHLWKVSRGRHETSVELVGRLTCVASCVDVPCALVGNEDSCLVAVDLVLPLNPRIIWWARVCEAAITTIKMSQSGRVAVVLTADGGAYLISALPSAGFAVRGVLETDGPPTAVDTYRRNGAAGPEDVLALLVTSGTGLLSFVRVVVVRDFEVAYSVTYGLDTVYAGLAVHSAASAVFTMSMQDRSLCCFTLREPEQLNTEQVSDLLWRPDTRTASGHELRQVHMRTVGRFLLSAADDGSLRGRSDDLNSTSNTEQGPLGGRHVRQTHQASSGGTKSFDMQSNGKLAALVGFDGTLMAVTLPYNQSGSARRRRSSYFENPAVPESRYVSAMRPLTQSDLMTMPPAWRELVIEQAWRRKENELVATRERISEGVETLRLKVKDMLDRNAQMEEMDRLPENEFELDLDEQARLEAASEARVQEAKSSIIDQNARNMYVRDQLKRQCWDAMDVKGKSIQGLMLDLEVSNYPLLPRSDQLMALLDGIQERRQLEEAEQQLQKDILEPSSPPAGRVSAPSSLHRRSSASVAAEPSAEDGPEDEPEEEEEDGEDEEDEGTPRQQTAHRGSVSYRLGVSNPWLQSQFDVTCRKQRVEQIFMLREVVYQLKAKFNERFEALYKTKCAEVERITEWSQRLRHIYSELNMSEEPWVPQWTTAEQPETLLTVRDDEVTVEKYLTPAERARLEAQAAEEERRRREREANDFRERALMQMMNGVLEVRWEDTLKEDVPRPEFMDAKDPSDWTDDEIKEAAEYEKKVVELEEEREKYRKMLEQELKKMLVTLQETVDKFDGSLDDLFTLKIQTEHAIDQEELRVNRLLRDVAQEDDREKREAELCHQMEQTQQRKVSLQTANADLRRALEAARAGHEPLVQQDRLMERSFRREFADVPANIVDVLFRYFRRRPQSLRQHMDASGRRSTLAEEGVIEVDHRRHSRRHSRSRRRSRHGSRSPASSNRESVSREPSTKDGPPRQSLAVPATRYGFSVSMRGGTPYLANLKTVPGKRAIIEAMKELDDDSQRCEEIAPPLWTKMCQLRLAKVLMEFQVLRSSAEVAALVDSIEKRRLAEEGLAIRTQQLISELAELREQRLRQLHDQEIQLVVKQGQVEIDLGDFCPDFTGSALIHRSRVEQLNKQILAIGGKKLEVMRDALRFRRGIVMQRWEYERCRMTLEDLVQKLRDIDFMKVTRGIQQYLVEGGDTTEKQIVRLERRLEILQQEACRKQEEDAEVADYLQRLLMIKRADNQRLALQARELNVDVSERELLYDIRCNHQRKWQARERLNNLRKIRDLCDIASFQQRYMAMLHGELQRVYSKTFPMLHVDG